MFLYLCDITKNRKHKFTTNNIIRNKEVRRLSKIYQLDNFLTVEYMKELVKRNGFGIVNEPPVELVHTLEYYKQHLTRALESPYIMREEEKVQVKIPVNTEEYYIMEWSIPKLKYLIHSNNISKTLISIDLFNSFDQGQNSHKKENEMIGKDEKDIIIASYPPIFSKYVVLTGNEALARSTRGAKNLDVFVLFPYIHLQAITRPIYRSLFAIHFNYSLICSYIAGQITMEEVENGIFLVY